MELFEREMQDDPQKLLTQKKSMNTHTERASGSDLLKHEIEQTPNYRVGVRTIVVIFALSLANCCATLSNTTNTIIKFQIMSVGGASEASWVANGNFLLTLACEPIFGSLADRVGKKWFIVGGCVLGVIGSFVSSSASTVHTLIGGNILVGIGNAGCIISIAANQEITPNRLRPYSFGFAQTINSVAAIAGTFLAGVFAQYSTWAWSYRFNGILFAIAGLSVLVTYFPPPTAIRRSGEVRTILLAVDYVGIILLAGSLASIVIGLTWGGTTYSWSSGTIIGTLVGGCAGLVVFGIFEWKVKTSNGLLDHRLFRTSNFPILCFVCLVDDLFNAGPVRIAVILSPYLITSTVGCLPAGWIMGKTKSYRILLIGALIWCSLFTGLMGLGDSSRIKYAYAFSALFGFGTAVTTVIPNSYTCCVAVDRLKVAALSLSVPSFLLGTAGTLAISARALGGITGITIFTAIYDNKYTVKLAKDVSAVVISAGGSQSLLKQVLVALSSPAPPAASLSMIEGLESELISPILVATSSASAASWKFVWVTIACIILANAVACYFLKSVSPRMNLHIESALESNGVRDQQLESKGEIEL